MMSTGHQVEMESHAGLASASGVAAPTVADGLHLDLGGTIIEESARKALKDLGVDPDAPSSGRL